jgi:integrase
MKGTGTIYKRPGSKLLWITYYRDGRRVRESSGSNDRRAAQQLLGQRLGQADRGEVIDARRGVTCADLWQGLEWDYRSNKRKSAKCLPCRWKHLAPFFADMRAQQVTYDRLERYIDARLAEHASDATINRELSALKTAFRLGRKKQSVRDVPDFPRLTENNTRKGFVEDQDYAKLTAHCSELWLRLFLEIAYSLAWRKSEILNLRVRNVSMAGRTIRLDAGSTKNSEGREAPMSAAAIPLVRQAIAGKAPDDYLLTRADGKPVRDFRRAWYKLTQAAGLPKLLVHDLRRSGARQLRRAGVPESVVQEIGGWKTREMFKRYAIVSSADRREAIEKLDQARNDGHSLGHSSTENGAAAISDEPRKIQ